jgi:DNA-directed RNA polymerase specialized sigma24 family protein
MTRAERNLVRKHAAMHAAGERLEKATQERDLAILEAAETMSKTKIAETLGIRRETVYNALARAALHTNKEKT